MALRSRYRIAGNHFFISRLEWVSWTSCPSFRRNGRASASSPAIASTATEGDAGGCCHRPVPPVDRGRLSHRDCRPFGRALWALRSHWRTDAVCKHSRYRRRVCVSSRRSHKRGVPSTAFRASLSVQCSTEQHTHRVEGRLGDCSKRNCRRVVPVCSEHRHGCVVGSDA